MPLTAPGGFSPGVIQCSSVVISYVSRYGFERQSASSLAWSSANTDPPPSSSTERAIA